MDELLRVTALAEGRHFWFRGFRTFITPLLERAAGGRRDLRILDCGCGTGNNLALLGRFGRPFGFDLTELGLRIGLEAGRTRLARASVLAVPFPSESFDILTSFDVLYAFEDREGRIAVAEMYRILKPGGFVVINVAAMEMLRGDHSVLGREARRYHRADLRAQLADAGFTILRLTYTNASLFVPLAISRAWQRWRGLRPEADAHHEISVPPEPLNTILTGVLKLESAWIRRFNAPFGSSLLCLAQKPRR